MGLVGGELTMPSWIKCSCQEPPKGVDILTYHFLNRIQMQTYDGAYFYDPITCPVDEDGNPVGFVSRYPKDVITHWMSLPEAPKTY